MKRQPRRLKHVLACLLPGICCFSAFAQYSLDWYTIDGGGRTSAGGAYSITGTIGQPDAGLAMTGGGYSLTGGFWSLLGAVSTPGAPALTIQRASGNAVMVRWPSTAPGWNLQENTGFDPASWRAPSEPVEDDGHVKFILVNPPIGQSFYRLFSDTRSIDSQP